MNMLCEYKYFAEVIRSVGNMVLNCIFCRDIAEIRIFPAIGENG